MPKIVDKALRRKEFLEAAAAVFAAKGYSRTRITDIASKAGVSKGMIYEYFTSKEDVFLEVCRSLVPWKSLPEEEGAPSLAGIERLVRDIEEAYGEAKDFFLIMSDFWSAAMHGPVDQRKIMLSEGRGFYQTPRARLVTFIRNGQRAGVFHAEATPLPLANMVLATIEGIRMQDILDPESAQKEATLLQLINTITLELTPS